MKTEIQIQRFVQAQRFKTQADLEMIIAFCYRRKHYFTLHDIVYDDAGVGISEFVEWFNNGFGSGEVVRCNQVLLLLGKCGLDDVCVVGSLAEGVFRPTQITVGVSELEHVDCDSRKLFLNKLAREGFQYDYETESLIPKYIPGVNDRVDFFNDEIKGTGVVRDYDVETGDVELYCYFLYKQNKVGHSMHEKGVCDLYGFNFTEATRGSQRRLEKELNKVGKTWHDKLHRIQPSDYGVGKGQRYYTINDKLRVVCYVEKGNKTSDFRKYAGNYFATYEEALDVAGKIHDVLRDNLAKPGVGGGE